MLNPKDFSVKEQVINRITQTFSKTLSVLVMCQNPILPLYTNNILLQVYFMFYAKIWYQICLAEFSFSIFESILYVCVCVCVCVSVCECVLNVPWNLFIDFLNLFLNVSSNPALFFIQLFTVMQLTRRHGTVLFVHFQSAVLPKQGV